MGTFNFLGESCESQMSEYPKLDVGTHVFKISRAEVREYAVSSSFILRDMFYKPDGRSYVLDDVNYIGLHDTATESSIGQTLFLDRYEAEEKAAEYISTHVVWLSKDIAIKESECWEKLSEWDGHTRYAWYILVPDTGILITKGDYKFVHAVDFGTEERARKHLNSVFIPSIEYQRTWDGKMIPYFTKSDKGKIEVPNLYPCQKSVRTLNPLTKDPEWDWAEDGYSNIADEATKIAIAKKELEIA